MKGQMVGTFHRNVRICAAILWIGWLNGCAPPTPAKSARERLRKLHVQCFEADIRMPFVNIPAADNGRLVAMALNNGDPSFNWDDAVFKRAVDDLRKLTDLDYLILRVTRITDESMSDLATLTQLRHLNLSATDVTDEGISKLSSLQNLEGLYLETLSVRGRCLEALKTLPIRKLSLRATPLNDEAALALGEMKQLEHLDLGGSQVGDATLACIWELPHLRTLLLDNTLITIEGVRHLTRAKKLERLAINGYERINDDVLRNLCQLPNLTRLDVNETVVTKESVAALRRDFPKLRISWAPSPP